MSRCITNPSAVEGCNTDSPNIAAASLQGMATSFTAVTVYHVFGDDCTCIDWNDCRPIDVITDKRVTSISSKISSAVRVLLRPAFYITPPS